MAGKPDRAVIYHNPKCTTSRKTLDLLRDNGVEATIVQYLKHPPSRDELVKMIQDVRTAVRKRESLYAELDLADATDDQSPASGWGYLPLAGEYPQLDAMAEHPILIERPF